MKPIRPLLAGLALALAVGCPAISRADVVETSDGSRLHGKIVKIDGGVVELETPFAGTLKINQAQVTALTTDAPVFLRTKSGNTVQGTVSTADGAVRVVGEGATGAATVANVEAVWVKPEQSPEARAAAAARRSWAYEASVDVLGKSGNSKSMATSVGFNATLAGPEDKLVFYANYARATQQVTVTSGTPPVTTNQNKTSVNQSRGGVDYSAHFSPELSWYVREEIGTDKIQDLSFYSTSAAGLGTTVINTKPEQLTFRTGLAYRYESYTTGSNVSAPAIDLTLLHAYTADIWKIGNLVTFLPSLQHFSDYRILHDSFFEIPLAASQWRIRLGIGNDYHSKPRPGKVSLDTTYYTKFLLDWK